MPPKNGVESYLDVFHGDYLRWRNLAWPIRTPLAWVDFLVDLARFEVLRNLGRVRMSYCFPLLLENRNEDFVIPETHGE